MHQLYRWEQFHLQQALATLGARSWMLPLLYKRTHTELLAFHQAFASVLLAPCNAPLAEPARAPDERSPHPLDEQALALPASKAAPGAFPSCPTPQLPSPMAEARRRVRRRTTPVFPR